MKETQRAICSLAFLLALSGCSKKPDVKASVSELEKAFPSAAATTAETPQTAPVPPLTANTSASAYVNAALSAARANDYVSGVMVLEEMQRKRGLQGVTPNQLMAVEQTKQAMIADLVARAERGDAKAKADLAAIEKTHSQ